MDRNRALLIGGLAVLLLVLIGLYVGSGGGSGSDWAPDDDGAKRTRLDGGKTWDPALQPKPEDLIPDLSAGGLLGPDADGLDPETMVTCAVEPALESASVEIIDDALPDIPEVAKIANGVLVIPAPRKEGSGVLKVSGYVPVAFSWAGGRCSAEPLKLEVGGAAVVGMVYNADGEPEGAVQVVGCGSSVQTNSDGSYYLEGIPGRACTVQASRSDGIFTATSEAKSVTPVANQDQVVDLNLPPFRTAGLGIVIRETAEGLEIERALEGGSGADAGLQPGDRVLEIDGEDAEMLSLDEFVGLALGEPGSEVELKVEGADGDVRALTLDRREM